MEALKLQPDSSVLSDEVIVKRIVAGEKELFEILLRRHNQLLFRVLRGYLQKDVEVEDAMQNAYLKAFNKLYQFQGHSQFSTWLIRIGINEALAIIGKMKKEKTIYLYAADDRNEDVKKITDGMNPEKQIIRQETERLLEHAIDNLPDKYRMVYILKEVQGLPIDQVAESLNISVENVKVRAHRAKNLLKETLYQTSISANVFEFGNLRCDSVVANVMNRIR
jgi:RNA polymerase sigma factor (sigma-70 family)